MKSRKERPATVTAFNGLRLGAGRQCVVGGPLEISKLGEDAKKAMRKSILVSTTSAGKRALDEKKKTEAVSKKAKRSRDQKAQRKQKAIERRQKVKQTKKQLKVTRKSALWKSKYRDVAD